MHFQLKRKRNRVTFQGLMSQIPIHFFSEDISYVLKEKIYIRKWLKNTILLENNKLDQINFIFCSDNYLLEINQTYLKHDTFTDIITFDNSEIPGSISGDIYISIDRIIENASNFNTNQRDELHRVMIHGVLHLLGYNDKSKAKKVIMSGKEDFYLNMRDF